MSHITAEYFLQCVQGDITFVGRVKVLLFVDVYSRYAWGKVIRSKRPDNVKAAFIKLFKDSLPSNVTTDNGGEFKGSFHTYLETKGIKHWMNNPGDHNHMGIIERFNRTMKELATKMRANIVIDLPDLLDQYNSTVHHTIGMKPVTAIRSALNVERVTQPKINPFKTGEHVRAVHSTHVSHGVRVYRVDRVEGGRVWVDGVKNYFQMNALTKTSDPISIVVKKAKPRVIERRVTRSMSKK